MPAQDLDNAVWLEALTDQKPIQLPVLGVVGNQRSPAKAPRKRRLNQRVVVEGAVTTNHSFWPEVESSSPGIETWPFELMYGFRFVALV